MTLFGLSGGISFFTIATVLIFRLSSNDVDIKIIGLFAFSGLCYNIRFLWPFLIDYVRIPYLSKKVGQRKSWGIISHIFSTIGFILLGCFEPSDNIILTFSISSLTAFFASIQDIVSDAYRFEFTKKNLPLSDSVPLQTIGFRTGQFFASSITPILGGIYGWFFAHMAIALIKCLSIVLMFCLEEPSEDKSKQIARNERKSDELKKSFSKLFNSTISKDFLLLFICSIFLLRSIDTIIAPIQTIFVGKLGISAMQFGTLKNGIGFISTMSGVMAAGFFIKKHNILKTLICAVIFQSLSGLLSVYLANEYLAQKNILNSLMVCSVFQDFFQGLMNTLTIIYISSFCEQEFSIYHFTLFSTISSITRTFCTSVFSFFCSFISWQIIFCIPIIICIPLVALFLYLYKAGLVLHVHQNEKANPA